MKRHALNDLLVKPTVTLICSVVCLLGFALSIPTSVSKEKIRWQSGRLLAADVSGYGSRAEARNRRSPRRGDIWWVYCVSSGGKAYSAVSRVSPDKAGLTLNRPVQFTADSKRIVIRNPKGERYTMQIVRQGDESICR